MIPQRFRLDTIMIDGREQALVSAVPFLNVDFGLAAHPSPRLEMPQVDYRAYIIDEHTGERAVWFFGTTLDSWSLPLPRYVWQQPWHAGRTRFDCRLGAYRVWHERLQVHPAELVNARFALFDRLGLVSLARQQQPYSVLVQPINDFTVYLPPTPLE